MSKRQAGGAEAHHQVGGKRGGGHIGEGIGSVLGCGLHRERAKKKNVVGDISKNS